MLLHHDRRSPIVESAALEVADRLFRRKRASLEVLAFVKRDLRRHLCGESARKEKQCEWKSCVHECLVQGAGFDSKRSHSQVAGAGFVNDPEVVGVIRGEI